MTDEEIQRFRQDITDIKVSVGELKSYLHSTPCPHLSNFEERVREDIRRLHEKQENHVREHHSSTVLRNNWLTWMILFATLLSNVIPRLLE